MIALSSSIGKYFHLILASRFQSFLLSNKLIDPSLQKAFLSNINGCLEHCSVLNSLLLHARTQKKLFIALGRILLTLLALFRTLSFLLPSHEISSLLKYNLILIVCTPNSPLQSPPLHGHPTLLSCTVGYS